MLHWLKKTINKSLFGINILMSFLLLMVYFAAIVPPSSVYFFAILALAYPFFLGINISFAIWWLYRRKRYFYLSLGTIILGYSHLGNFISIHFPTPPTVDTLHIMSYNVRYFNASFYKKGNPKLAEEQQKILTIIAAQTLDIFCGQEFSGKSQAYNQTAKEVLAQKLKLKYSYQAGGSSLAIYSKYPIIKTGAIQFDNTYNGAIFADIQLQNKKIRVYNFHLQSIRLGNDEAEVLNQQNITTLAENDTQEKYKRINGKLKNAFLLREEQVQFIAQHISESPYPVVVCGDLNDTPSSYAYHCLVQNLQDAFANKGFGFGSTYAGKLPFLRIDYTFVSPLINLQSFQVLPQTFSDHYPIYTQVAFF